MGWMFTTWLALIALQTFSTKGASGRVAGAFADVNTLVDRLLDANIPAVPDRRAGATSTTNKLDAAVAAKTAMTSTPPSPSLAPRSPLYSRLPRSTT